MAFKHNTGLTSDGVLQQGDYESTSGHLLDSQAEGDLIVADSSTTMTRLGAGAANTVLTSNGTTPSYNKLTTSNIDGGALVTSGEGIGDNNNDTTIPTSAAVKSYVDAQVGGTTLTFADDGATTGSVDLSAEQFTVAGTANEIETSASGQTITIGLPNNVTINTLTATNPIATGSGGTGQNLSLATGSMYVASGTVSAVDMATKGHLLVGDGTGAPSTLAVGSDDYLLTADSTTGTGLKWAAVAATQNTITSIPNLTTVGTIGTGTWEGTAVADTYVANDLTIDGGTVDNSVIGGTTPAAGTFTTLTISGTTNITEVIEDGTVSATAATGTINYDLLTQSVLYYTSNASANWTVNIRGDSGTTLSSLLDVGDSASFVFMVTQGSTAYYPTAFQVDGSSVTPKWQGGTAPTGGNASSIDVYSYTVIKTAATPTYTVFAAQTQFA